MSKLVFKTSEEAMIKLEEDYSAIYNAINEHVEEFSGSSTSFLDDCFDFSHYDDIESKLPYGWRFYRSGETFIVRVCPKHDEQNFYMTNVSADYEDDIRGVCGENTYDNDIYVPQIIVDLSKTFGLYDEKIIKIENPI